MPDLIVIGAGVAGASLAAAGAQRGWRVLLLEHRPFPRHKVCGEFLSPEALHSLSSLGLYSAVAQVAPVPITKARLISPSGVTLGLDLPGLAWGLSRYSLDKCLLQAAQQAGAELQTGVRVTHITPLPGDGYQVAMGGRWLKSRAVVAAWGRQTVPSLRKHPRPRPGQSWLGIKGHYQGLSPGPAVEIYLLPGGYVGVAAIEGGRHNCSALISHSTFREAGGRPETFLTWAGQQNPALARRLAPGGPVEGTGVTISGVDTTQGPTPWSLYPLIGDAAAVIPPLVGDGMAMALRSTELLLPLLEQHLAGHLTRPGLAAAYGRHYREEFAARLRWARWLQLGLVHPLGGEGLLRLGRLFPGLAHRLLLATRGTLPGHERPLPF